MLIQHELSALGDPSLIDRTKFDWFYDATTVTHDGSDNVLTSTNQGVGVFGNCVKSGGGGNNTPRSVWRNGMYAITPTSTTDTLSFAGYGGGMGTGTLLFIGQIPSAAQMAANFRVILGGNIGALFYPFYTGTSAGQWEINKGTARAWSGSRPAGDTPIAAVIRIDGASSKLDVKPLGGAVFSSTVAGSPGTNAWPASSLLWGVGTDGLYPWSAPYAAIGKSIGSAVWSDAETATILSQASSEYAL